MKLSKGWSAYIFPKNNLRYHTVIVVLTNSLKADTIVYSGHLKENQNSMRRDEEYASRGKRTLHTVYAFIG